MINSQNLITIGFEHKKNGWMEFWNGNFCISTKNNTYGWVVNFERGGMKESVLIPRIFHTIEEIQQLIKICIGDERHN